MKQTKSIKSDKMLNICQQVTDKLIALMEQGINPWRMPWVISGIEGAISHTNGKPYSLINQILLGGRAGEYLTFNQVKKEGGRVKKGAKSEIIVFWQCGGYKVVKPLDDENDIDNEETKQTDNADENVGIWVSWKNPILKYYRVFHIDDCEGIKPRYAAKSNEVMNYTPRIEEDAENVAKAYCQRYHISLCIQKSDQAFYRPSTDMVVVPLREQFSDTTEFYSTLYHELIHSTGHETRLSRFKGGVHNAGAEHSREELIAEIGSAACLAKLGINSKATDENSAAYLKAWANFLKDDPKAFVVAAGKADKAVKMIFDIKH